MYSVVVVVIVVHYQYLMMYRSFLLTFIIICSRVTCVNVNIQHLIVVLFV